MPLCYNIKMLCTYPACKNKLLCKDLCSGHYQQQAAGKSLKPIRPRRSRNSLPVNEQSEIRRLANIAILSNLPILINFQGYPCAYIPMPDGTKRCRRIHRLVMEHHLGRSLTSKEVVHHGKTGIRNPSIDNLTLFSSQSEHLKHCHAHILKGGALQNSLKTHCSRGHLLAGLNLRKGTRQCRLCCNLNQNRRNAEQRQRTRKL